MSATVSRFPEQTRPREIRYRRVHEIAEELFRFEAVEGDGDGMALATKFREMASERLRVLEKKL